MILQFGHVKFVPLGPQADVFHLEDAVADGALLIVGWILRPGRLGHDDRI